MNIKNAEFLAEADLGMTFQGGINGGWTYPTSDPKLAAQYMQVSADLRAQMNSYHGGADKGHVTSQHAAQLAANGIRNTQLQLESINRQSCISGPSNLAYQPIQERREIQAYNASIDRNSAAKRDIANIQEQLQNLSGFSHEDDKKRKELAERLNKAYREL